MLVPNTIFKYKNLKTISIFLQCFIYLMSSSLKTYFIVFFLKHIKGIKTTALAEDYKKAMNICFY